jgi:parallel beta-helix repeat protein
MYYVAKNGEDSNPGTFKKPFLTINKAAKIAIAGDIVYVREGTYKERVLPKTSGEPGKYITFKNFENEQVIIDASGLPQGIMLAGVYYIRVQGFTVLNSSHSGIHIQDRFGNEGGYNIIQENTVKYCGTENYSGIYIGGSNNDVSHNYVSGSGSRIKGHGIYVFGNHNVVGDNEIFSNTRMGIRMEGDYNMINKNIIYNNGEYGISIWVDEGQTCKNTIILQNLIYNNVLGGIRVYGFGAGDKPNHVHIFNNTIINLGGESGIKIGGGPKNTQILNNIITGEMKKLISTDDQSLDGYIENYNIFFGSEIFMHASIRYDSFEEYRQATSLSTNSYFQNPLLTDGHHPTKESIAVDNAIDIGIPYSGNAPDIGAFEFKPPIKPPTKLKILLKK